MFQSARVFCQRSFGIVTRFCILVFISVIVSCITPCLFYFSLPIFFTSFSLSHHHQLHPIDIVIDLHQHRILIHLFFHCCCFFRYFPIPHHIPFIIYLLTNIHSTTSCTCLLPTSIKEHFYLIY